MISNRNKYVLSCVIFLLGLLLPLSASAKLPPIDFASKRLLKNRVPSQYNIEISVLEKTITKYLGEAELFSGNFKVGTFAISRDLPSTATKLLAIALGSQNVFQDVQTTFSKLDKTRSVGVQSDLLTHRYGSTTRVSIFRDSGALAQIRVSEGGKLWVLKVSDRGEVRIGTVYHSGLIVMRFTMSQYKKSKEK